MKVHETEKFEIFTVCNIAYLPRALVLGDSVLKYCGKKLKVVVFDAKCDIENLYRDIEIIWLEELGVPKWRELAFLYDIVEFSTSLKPFIAMKLMERAESVIFLDPDTCMFSSLDPILQDLENCSILLTPHYTAPQPRTELESDLPMMRFGSFNMGFFGVKNTEAGRNFLSWWHERCIDFCYMESQFGLSTDQKWISIAPCLFRDISISFNLGYNAAPWNTFEREITSVNGDECYLNNEYKLVFYHFSNFKHDDPQYLNKRASSEASNKYPLLEELGMEYSRRLQEKTGQVEITPYAYDFMSDGSFISPTLRRAYSAVRSELPEGHNPFDSLGVVGKFAKKNALLEKNKTAYAYPGIKDAEKHTNTMNFIYIVLRLVLRILGPNRFYDLSKLMVYLSTYRRNRGLWRL